MSDNVPPESSIILYQTEDGRTRIECRFQSETIWLTQALIAELFQKDVRTISEHLANIFEDDELSRNSTIRRFRMVRLEGTREVEINELNRFVVMFLDFAEDQARRRKHIFLHTWRERLDDFLKLNERTILPDAGTVSREQADAIAEQEYERFAARRRALHEAVDGPSGGKVCRDPNRRGRGRWVRGAALRAGESRRPLSRCARGLHERDSLRVGSDTATSGCDRRRARS